MTLPLPSKGFLPISSLSEDSVLTPGLRTELQGATGGSATKWGSRPGLPWGGAGPLRDAPSTSTCPHAPPPGGGAREAEGCSTCQLGFQKIRVIITATASGLPVTD